MKSIHERNTNLCVGIDISPEAAGVPNNDLSSLIDHSYKVIEATREFAVAYKPNLAFFERYGSRGFAWLENLVKRIGPEYIIIGDGKRGDIGNTARQYADALFRHFNFDAVTVNPYMGEDAVIPFTDNPEKGVFVLCRTSNPGAMEIQGVGQAKPLYLRVAEMVKRLNINQNMGLVVGATAPGEMKEIREAAYDIPFLIPGIGAQGGDLETSVRIGNTGGGALINISRSIIFAGGGTEMDIRKAAENYVTDLRKYL